MLRPGHLVREGFYKLDPDKPLEQVLKHKQFVEYPTIEIYEDGAFTGTIVDDRGAVLLSEEEERKPKRRKMGVQEGKKAINGLLGGYGSDKGDDTDGGGEGDEEEEQNVLNSLAGYAGSDDDETEEPIAPPSLRPGEVWLKDDELGDEDAEGDTDEEDVEETKEEGEEDLAGMLEKLRKAGALRGPGGNGSFGGHEADDDQVDWGDSDDDL